MSARQSPMSREHAANFARDGIAPSTGVARLRLRGRLNLFQTAMLRWRELHPYNAVHVVRVPQAARLRPSEPKMAEFGAVQFAPYEMPDTFWSAPLAMKFPGN